MTNPENQAFFTEQEFADYVHVSYWTVRGWREKGLVTHVRVGRLIRYERVEVERFIDHHRVLRVTSLSAEPVCATG